MRWTSDRLHHPGAGATSSRPRLLLLCDYQPDNAATVIDHIEAIRAWSENDVYVLPMLRDLPDDLDLGAFDGLVIHYNLIMADAGYLSPLARWRISQFGGVKGAFIQDEYRFVDRTVSVMATLGIEVLFTCVPEDQVRLVYTPEALPQLRRTVTVLTGFVPERLLEVPVVPYEQRTIDVGYRARRLPAWLGSLGQEKSLIADRFEADAPAHGLTVDISCREEDRLYGESWIRFVGNSRAMLGVESGASVFDFNGSIEAAIRAHLAEHPETPFEELERRFLAGVDGRIRLNQISPRCFEAAALRTLMVLYPGEYSGILAPWRHYVPLAKDHSNMAEVVATIRNRATWEEITTRARQEVAENPAWSFRALAQTLDAGLALSPGRGSPVSATSFEAVARRSLGAMAGLRPLPPGSPRSARLFRLARNAGRLLPSPTSLGTYPGQDEARHASLRRRVRHIRAWAWWVLRPRLLSPGLLATHGTRLLEELSLLGLLQEMGHRAVATGSGTPFLLVADRTDGSLRIVHRPPGGRVGEALPRVPLNQPWPGGITVDLENEWLVPIGAGDGRARRLEALSQVLRSRPTAARRLLERLAPWCSVVRLGRPVPEGESGRQAA